MGCSLSSFSLDPRGENFQGALQDIADRLTNQPIQITIEMSNKADYLLKLAEWIHTLPSYSIAKISLHLNSELLSTIEFQQLLTVLKAHRPQVAELVFDEVELSSLEKTLLTQVATKADFPVVIVNHETQEKVSYKQFENLMIAAIQTAPPLAVNQANNQPLIDTIFDDPVTSENKLRLKSLINANASNKEFDQFVSIELEHTEAVEQTVEEIAEVVVTHEKTVASYNGELVDYQHFNAAPYHNIAARSIFNKTQIDEAFKLAEYELFANLPEAVKYLTPAAAEKLAANLPQWVAFNKENFSRFVLKKTPLGEHVLDYELDDGSDEEKSPLSPHEFSPYQDKAPYYLVDLPSKSLLDSWIQNEVISKNLQKLNNLPLMNLWLRHGDKGVNHFFAQLKQLDIKDNTLSTFIYDHYLSAFDHLDPFYNQTFFDTLERLKSYSPLQISCLKRFLNKTSSSQHDLSKTLDGFDYFWGEFKSLCKHDEELMGQLDTQWSTPEGGQPVVYMERLLTLLKNARNLPEQLTCLHDIKLDQYGAYYFSHYEKATGVHPAMRFLYEPKKLNQLPFNPNAYLYRIELEKLCEIAQDSTAIIKKGASSVDATSIIESKEQLIAKKPEEINKLAFAEYMTNVYELPTSFSLYFQHKESPFYLQDDHLPCSAIKFYTLAYRYIGQQQAGISAGDFINQFSQIRKSSHSYRIKSGYLEDDVTFGLPLQLLQTLFLIAHAGYTGNIPTEKNPDDKTAFELFFDNSESIIIESMLQEIERLKKLARYQIKLNDKEALCYIGMQKSKRAIGIPQEQEKEFYQRVAENKDRSESYKSSTWWHAVSIEFPIRFVEKLIANKYAAFKFMHFYWSMKKQFKKSFKVGNEGLVVIYSLNIEEFFAEIPEVNLHFRDDLLLFSLMLKNPMLNLRHSDFKHQMQSNSTDVLELKEIRTYLTKAATGERTTNYLAYGFKLFIDAETLLSNELVLKIFAELSQLSLNNDQLDEEAAHQIFTKHNVPVNIKTSPLLRRNNQEIKGFIIEMILTLELMQQGKSFIETFSEDFDEETRAFFTNRKQQLHQLSVSRLQITLNQTLKKSSLLVRAAVAAPLNILLGRMRDSLIEEAFRFDESNYFIALLAQYSLSLNDLQDFSDFDKLDRIVSQIEPIAASCKQIAKHSTVIEQEELFKEFLSSLQFNHLDSQLVASWLDIFTNMPQRDYLPIMKAMAVDNFIYSEKNKPNFLKLIQYVASLHANEWSTEYIVNFCNRFIAHPPRKDNDYELVVKQLISLHASNSADPLLTIFLTNPNLSFNEIIDMSNDTIYIRDFREKLANFYSHLIAKNELKSLLTETNKLDSEQKTLILSIFAAAHAVRRPKDADILAIDMLKRLQTLSLEQLKNLEAHCATTPLSAACLFNALGSFDRQSSFSSFLEKIEKSPFGERNLAEQFDRSAVERVVNFSKDLLNRSTYPKQYRQKLMEMFLLVDEMGSTLPVYNKKCAMDLSNNEIKAFFLQLKNNTTYSPTQRRLLALGLLREAMYRSTGQFPYSTQMIAIIDCLLHPGDVISNIDTGQGKSLIDMMKAALLWVENDRVEMTTSSLIDAQRDIDNYGPFLRSVGIPFADKPITASSSFDKFRLDGINISTFAQLRLFFSKAIASDHSFKTPNNKISIILNESDYALLDDLAIKRFATSEGINIAKKHPWIYEAVNDFVHEGIFTANNTSVATDIRLLRGYLIKKAQACGKNRAIISQIENDTLLEWLESALLVNYKFREKYDFVTVPIGEQEDNYEAKILMSDKKPSSDSVFGKGAHQLLHAHLNKQEQLKTTATNKKVFEIKPQNKTIISADNRSLIHYYQSQNGVIWGSSGTTGSNEELQELFKKYGFDFSKIEPHQENQVRENKLKTFPDQALQYASLKQEIEYKRKNNNKAPTLIFCENIEKAEALYAYLKQELGNNLLQLFTGLGNEKEVIENAALAGMYTITTAAIGRNTDIPYDKQIGLNIWHTYIDSTRIDRQKSGRTGRQGSPGEISYFLNTADQSIQTQENIEKLRMEMDQDAARERAYHEQLYLILGHFLAQIEKIDSTRFTTLSKQAFFRQQWSLFSGKYEKMYQELHIQQQFNRETFISALKEDLLQRVQAVVPSYQTEELAPLIESMYIAEDYLPNTEALTIAECTPPITITYELFNLNLDPNKNEITEDIKEKIIKELTLLFSDVKTTFDSQKHKQFLHFLQATPVTQAALKTIYQDFLTNFINDNKQSSPLVKRWFGFADTLNQMTNNQQYLWLFRSLTCIDKITTVVNVLTIKEAMAELINEYLENSWFISTEKRQAAENLKNTILQKDSDLTAVIEALVKSQITIAKHDLELNKTRYFSTNFFGRSRYQETISNALRLAVSLGVQVKTDKLVTKLTNQLELILKEPNQIKVSRFALDDTTKQIRQSPKSTDNSNAQVLARSLEAALELDQQQKEFLPEPRRMQLK